MGRRRLLGLSGLCAAAVGSQASCTPRSPFWRGEAEPTPARTDPAAGTSLTAQQAWVRLALGNARFSAGKPQRPHQGTVWRAGLLHSQQPYACVLACVDSRVPPELVFDAGLGDLVTVRSAAQVLDAAVLGSVEYAVQELGVPLVVVLGHQDCDVVAAAVDTVHHHRPVPNAPGVGAIVREVEAAVRSAPSKDEDPQDRAGLVEACVAHQAARTARLLVEQSPVLATARRRRLDPLRVLALTYDLESGLVTQVRVDPDDPEAKEPMPGAQGALRAAN